MEKTISKIKGVCLIMKLLDVCEFIVDCPHSTAPDEGTGYPLIRTPNVGRGRLKLDNVQRVSKDVYDRRNKRAVPQVDDIIFAREAPAGNAAIICEGQEVCLGQRTVLIRPDKDKVYPKYLVYYMLAPQQQYELLGTANGATVAHVNIPVIKNLTIRLPEMDTQKKIANIISSYDDLIENNQKQIKLLEEAAQRLYKEWFVDLRFPGHENVAIVDGVPEGWHMGIIDEVLLYHDKVRKPLSSLQRANFKGPYRYYGAAGILDYVQEYLFDGTYLLLGEDGSVITTEGTPVVQYVTGKFWVNNHAHVLTGKEPFSTEYIYMMFKKMGVSDVVTGVAQPKISQARLSAKKILIPDTDIVEDFQEKVKSMFERILVLEGQTELLAQARDRLLPKLMSGEIEV